MGVLVFVQASQTREGEEEEGVEGKKRKQRGHITRTRRLTARQLAQLRDTLAWVPRFIVNLMVNGASRKQGSDAHTVIGAQPILLIEETVTDTIPFQAQSIVGVQI
jgi:hypothetical protein